MSVAETGKSPWAPNRRKRGSQFPAKREAVLAAAAALMRRGGYKEMSLADLADILNITKPTLYYYVSSKEELFAEIVTRAQQETLDLIRSVAAEDNLNGYDRLRRIMVGYAEIVSSDFGACLLLPRPTYVEAGVHLQLQSRVREANELIYKVLLDGRDDGSLQVSDPTITLHTLFGSLNWIPRWYRSNGRLSLRRVAEIQADMLLNGVRGPTAQPAPQPTTDRPRRQSAKRGG